MLGGSWVVISRVINPLIWVITIVNPIITPLITTHEPPSVELPGLHQLFKSPGCVLLKGLRQEVGAAAFLEFGVEGSGV